MTFADELNYILADNATQAIDRNQRRYHDIVGWRHPKTVFVGAGFIGRRALARLRSSVDRPVAFADNNRELHGTHIDGIPVMSIEEAAAKFKDVAVFVVMVYNHELLMPQLARLQVQRCSYLPYFYANHHALLPCYSFAKPYEIFKQQDKVKAVCNLWHDRHSQHIYVGLIRWHINQDARGLRERSDLKDIYFDPEIIQLHDHEMLVDCGAYKGDTIKSFGNRMGWRFNRIEAFEPDRCTFDTLKFYVETLPAETSQRICCHQYAVTEKSEVRTFHAMGTTASALATKATESLPFEGNLPQVGCVPLDRVINHVPTFIKMDIEGAEPEALRGAQELIRGNRPILAISVYHEQSHLWTIPEWIHETLPDYHLYLRRYLGEFWDVICYAVPPERAIL